MIRKMGQKRGKIKMMNGIGMFGIMIMIIKMWEASKVTMIIYWTPRKIKQ